MSQYNVAPTAQAARAARTGLIVLTLVNMLNYVDRQVVSALGPSLMSPDGLHLSYTQFGSLASAFMILYMISSPIFGKLGDRVHRPKLMAVGVAIWSTFTALGACAWSFLSLFAFRAVVGIGEAAYGPVSPAILGDYFKKAQRGRVFAIFSSAIPIGSALGYVLGGFIAVNWGWREAFLVAGVPGAVLAVLIWRLSDPPRGGQDEGFVGGRTGAGNEPILKAYRRLVCNRPYALTILGYTAYTFALGGLVVFMPTFLYQLRGMSLGEATIQFGAAVIVTGFIGTFAGGYLGDYLLKRFNQAYLIVCGVSTLLAVPFAAIALTSTDKSIYFPAIIVAQLCLFASTGPVNSAIVNLVDPLERASAGALSIFAIHILGDVPSPAIIGWISDHSDLGRAMLMVPIAIALSGILWLVAAWTCARKEQKSLSE
jgi:MFS transporter, Spinster family, sphingosine-1-phosphate transporter